MGWTGRSLVSSPADGVVLMTNNAGSAFTGIKLGGTTSSFPMLQRSGAGLVARLADDSANAAFTALRLATGDGSSSVAAVQVGDTDTGFYRRWSDGLDVLVNGWVVAEWGNANGSSLAFPSGAVIGWTASDVTQVMEVGLGRNSSTCLEINNGSGGTFRDLKLRNFEATGTMKFGTHTGIAAESVTGYLTVTDAAGNSRKLAVVS